MPLPFLAAAPAVITGAKWVSALAVYVSPLFFEDKSPEMINEIKGSLNAVHADSDALVINATERLKQEEEDFTQGHARLGEVVTRLSSEVGSIEERQAIPTVPSPESHTETLRRLTDAQKRTGESVDKQQVDIAVISDKLENLPALLRVTQENKALRFRNETLEAKISAFEKQLAETSLYAEQINAFAKEQQVEIDEQQVEIDSLQNQLRAQKSAENKENTSTSVSFFARNS